MYTTRITKLRAGAYHVSPNSVAVKDRSTPLLQLRPNHDRTPLRSWDPQSAVVVAKTLRAVSGAHGERHDTSAKVKTMALASYSSDCQRDSPGLSRLRLLG